MNSAKVRYICIHGHFYQPPRENPWLRQIEIQESAHPWHDWNTRISTECYGPNTQARILDNKGWLVEIINNYEHISFNFGPTLLSWLEEHDPETHQAIVQADMVSRGRRSGHGNAIAQAYNHMIMPLASSRDKITQIVWGIEDFHKRFGRDPEGMWLPETAVDLETLEILVDHGIRFTILAPGQAETYRNSPEGQWVTVSQESIDPSRPYLCRLPNGDEIAIFFYDGPISHDIAFRGLLDNGEELKNRLLAGFSDKRTWRQLVNIATDGESYGHHHRFGEMALAYALTRLRALRDVTLTNYGEFLEKYPPSAEVRIVEASSWSCAHGVGRWYRDCGCCVEHKPGWNQKWRRPLRASLDLLRDRVDRIYEAQSSKFLKDPWKAKDEYIRVVLDNHDTIPRFLSEHTKGALSDAERVLVLKLLEIQHNRMLMYTSCGWFFDDISGIESLQILRYAARVLQLASPFDTSLEKDFLEELAEARSNARPFPTGSDIFQRQITPDITGLEKVAAHATVSSIFEEGADGTSVYLYTVKLQDSVQDEFAERLLVIRHLSILDRVTTDEQQFVVAMLYLGGVDFRCSVKVFESPENYTAVKEDLLASFSRHSSTELIRKMDLHFPGSYFTLQDLFMEQRREIIDSVTERMYEEQARFLDKFYKENKSLAALIRENGARLPDTFLVAAQLVLNRSFLKELAKLSEGRFPDKLESILDEAKFWKIAPDISSAEKLIRSRILGLLTGLGSDPRDETQPSEIIRFLDLCRDMEIPIQLGEAQILFLRTIRSTNPGSAEKLPPQIEELAHRLRVAMPSHSTA